MELICCIAVLATDWMENCHVITSLYHNLPVCEDLLPFFENGGGYGVFKFYLKFWTCKFTGTLPQRKEIELCLLCVMLTAARHVLTKH
jgi:hypothetical protein